MNLKYIIVHYGTPNLMFVLKKLKCLKFAKKPLPSKEIFCSIFLNLFPILFPVNLKHLQLYLLRSCFIPLSQFHQYLLIRFPPPNIVKQIANEWKKKIF